MLPTQSISYFDLCPETLATVRAFVDSISLTLFKNYNSILRYFWLSGCLFERGGLCVYYFAFGKGRGLEELWGTILIIREFLNYEHYFRLSILVGNGFALIVEEKERARNVFNRNNQIPCSFIVT